MVLTIVMKSLLMTCYNLGGDNMLNVIIKAIFYVIGKIGDIVLAPILTLINSLIPDFSTIFSYMWNYLNQGVQFIKFWCQLLLIPPTCINIVLSILTLTISITVGVRAYSFIVKIYNKFKP